MKLVSSKDPGNNLVWPFHFVRKWTKTKKRHVCCLWRSHGELAADGKPQVPDWQPRAVPGSSHSSVPIQAASLQEGGVQSPDTSSEWWWSSVLSNAGLSHLLSSPPGAIDLRLAGLFYDKYFCLKASALVIHLRVSPAWLQWDAVWGVGERVS